MTELPQGHSGYFSPPSDILDPDIFDGMKLKTEVRDRIIGNLGQWFSANGYHVTWSALHLWLTGSGASYQWAADRGNGDLDIMVSIDIVPFIESNPAFTGWGESDLAAHLTDQMRATLWPVTEHEQFGEKTYEVTYYWNAGTGDDIRHIHPYAAYDLKLQRWDVKPPALPADPRTLYDASWFEAADADAHVAKELTRLISQEMSALNAARLGSAAAQNASSHIIRLSAQARALYDEIHVGRHGAFTDQGTGYGDFRNFRWQRAKESGAAEQLRAMASFADDVRQQLDAPFGTIEPADRAARQAALWRSRR